MNQYDGKVSGDFPERFVRGEAKNKAQKFQAQSEIDLATDFLEEKTILKNFDEVKAIPESKNQDGILTPDYQLIFGDDTIRLAESKAPDGNLDRNNLVRNLRKAINQLSTKEPSDLRGYVRLDYSSSSTNINRSEIIRFVDETLTETRQIGKTETREIIGTNFVEFVEVLYKDNSGQLKNLLFQVKNGQINIIPEA